MFNIYDVTIWLTNNCNTHMLNISRSESKQRMKFCQLIEYNKRYVFFFKNHAENEAKKLVPDVFLFFKKALYVVKASRLQLSFNIFQ